VHTGDEPGASENHMLARTPLRLLACTILLCTSPQLALAQDLSYTQIIRDANIKPE
jgi:hypothetical protein